jgi:hypothetical protein
MSKLTFVVRSDLGNLGWIVKASHDEMGEIPVGPRLAKGTRFPNEIGTSFENKSDALRACSSWRDWYENQPYVKKAPGKRAKYIA